VLFRSTATTTSQWYTLDYAYDENPERAFFIKQASGHTVTLQVGASVKDNNGNVDTYYNVSTFDATSADGVLTGNWPSIRFINIGTGPAGTSTTVIVG
jgi:hypothetical protein